MMGVMLLLCNCGAPRSVVSGSSDSVRVEIIERRVVLRDTITVEIPHEVERVRVMQDSSVLTNNFSKSEAIICTDGTLYHSLETLPSSLRWPIANEVEVRDSIVYRERVVTNVVEVERKLTTWQQIEITGFYILLLLVAIMLLLWRVF